MSPLAKIKKDQKGGKGEGSARQSKENGGLFGDSKGLLGGLGDNTPQKLDDFCDFKVKNVASRNA